MQPPSGDLLGGHVTRRPENPAGGRLGALENLRDAEVGDLQQPVGGEHHVVGLDVPVQDVVGVRGLQRRRGRQAQRAGGLRGDRAGRQPLAQGAAGEQLHDEQTAASMLDVVMDAHDVRVVEFGQDAGLGEEAGPQVRVVGRVEQHLDRDVAADQPMTAAEDQPVATAAEFAFDLVAGESGLHQRAINQQRSVPSATVWTAIPASVPEPQNSRECTTVTVRRSRRGSQPTLTDG